MSLLAVLGILKSKFVYIPVLIIGIFVAGMITQHKREANKEAKVIVKEVIKYVDRVQKVRERYRSKPFTVNEVLSGRASSHCTEGVCK